MYTVRRSLHYAYPYFNIVLGFGVLILGSIAWGIYQETTAVYQEIAPGFYQATNIPEHYPIIASYSLVALALLVMFPRQYVLDVWNERHRFNQNFKRLPIEKGTLLVTIGTIVAVVGILGIQWLERFFESSWAANATQTFIFVFTILYYIGIYLIVPRHYKDILDYLNSTGPDTSLKMERNKGRIDVRLYGRFRKAAIDFSFDYSEFIPTSRRRPWPGKMTNIKLSCTLDKLKGGPTSEFRIVDKNKRWLVVRGQDIDDCFNQRFSVKGGSTLKLSDEFKAALLHYPRHVDLSLKRNSIRYDAVYTTHPPYRTREGMILLWVDLLNWYEISPAK